MIKTQSAKVCYYENSVWVRHTFTSDVDFRRVTSYYECGSDDQAERLVECLLQTVKSDA